MRARILWLVVGLSILSFAVVTGASAQETGSIRGTVTNGTAGGEDVVGLTVFLNRYQGMDIAETFTTEVQEDGTYEFTDIPIVEGEAFLTLVKHSGVDYYSEMILLSTEPDAVADITVHETTNDPSAIVVSSRGIILSGADPDTRLVEVFEIVGVDNATDRSYVGTDGTVLQLPLPDGAAQITPQPGFDYGTPRLVNGTFITTGAIQPGEQTALLAYSVPYSGDSTTIEIGTAMPTSTMRILVRENTFDISSPALNDVGTVDVSGDLYHVLSVDNPIVGDAISVSVGNLPKAGSSGDSSNGPLYAGVAAGVGLLAAGGLTAVALRRRSKSSAREDIPTGEGVAPTGDVIEDERLALAAELNELDDELAAGTIDQAAYDSERQEILEELRAVTRRRRGIEDASV